MRLGTLTLTVLVVLAGCAGPASIADTPTRSSAVNSTVTATDTPVTSTATSSPTATPGETETVIGAENRSPPAATFLVDDRPEITITLEVADTSEERQRGLMDRRALARNHGMLFLFPGEAPRTFWMKNTYIPLDMIFIDANGTVLNVEYASPQPNATSEELRRYHSAGPAKYVIEVRRGFTNRTGIGPGAEVRLHLNRSPAVRDRSSRSHPLFHSSHRDS